MLRGECICDAAAALLLRQETHRLRHHHLHRAKHTATHSSKDITYLDMCIEMCANMCKDKGTAVANMSQACIPPTIAACLPSVPVQPRRHLVVVVVVAVAAAVVAVTRVCGFGRALSALTVTGCPVCSSLPSDASHTVDHSFTYGHYTRGRWRCLGGLPKNMRIVAAVFCIKRMGCDHAYVDGYGHRAGVLHLHVCGHGARWPAPSCVRPWGQVACTIAMSSLLEVPLVAFCKCTRKSW